VAWRGRLAPSVLRVWALFARPLHTWRQNAASLRHALFLLRTLYPPVLCVSPKPPIGVCRRALYACNRSSAAVTRVACMRLSPGGRPGRAKAGWLLRTSEHAGRMAWGRARLLTTLLPPACHADQAIALEGLAKRRRRLEYELRQRGDFSTISTHLKEACAARGTRLS